jgi:hypothetical protein
MTPDTFLARALLASGMLSRTQLDIALKWLEESPASGLGDVLCTNGAIRRQVYEALMRFYKKDNSRLVATTGNRDRGVREAQLFCLIAMREDELSDDQMKDAVDQWVRLEGMGNLRPIHDVMIEKGYMDLAKSRQMLALTKESTLACGTCGQADSLYKTTGTAFTCESCKAALVPTKVKPGGEAPPVDSMAGKVYGGCRLEERIGTGRYSLVFKGLIPSQNRPAAVKLFAPDTPPDALERWLAAAKQSQRYLHASLVSTIECGRGEDGRGFVVMELVSGKAPAKREKLNWQRLCRAGIDLARALGPIHAHNHLHGNIRPESVLLTEKGAKLCDFGQAHQGAAPVPGDAKCLAPELWQNEAAEPRSDLYSLGATLYTMAAGQPPFEEDDPRLLEMAHRSKTPRPPGAYNLELPRGVSYVIMKLLEKDPNARYGFAEEVARDFETVLKGEMPGALAAEGKGVGKTCPHCKTPNPPGEEKTCVLCGKPLRLAEDQLLLDGEVLCPKCQGPLAPDAAACKCGFKPCKKCRVADADPETGYCGNCLSPEAAAEIKRRKQFRAGPKLGKPVLHRPATGVLKPPPPVAGAPVTANLKPPPPAAGGPATAHLKPPPPAAAGLKPPPPAAGKPAGGPPSRVLKAPPPAATSPAPEDDLDFENLPPPAAKPPATPAAAEEDLDFDNLPPVERKPASNDDLLGEPPPPAKPPPSNKPRTSLYDRRRRP